MAKKLTYEEYLSPNYRPIMQQGQQDIAAKFKATMERNAKIANSPLEDRDGVDVDLDIVPTATPNAGNVSTGTNVLGNESATDAVKSLYVQPNLIQAKGYTEWLEAGGMAGAAQRQYDATVRAAETDYAKSKALYGQNAETLGRAGLTGSGYGDYLTGAGFAAMQGAKVAAADTKALTEAQQRTGYANYLLGVEQANAEAQAAADAQNRQTYAEYLSREGGAKEAIDAAMAQGLDDAAIRSYVQQRYGNEFDSYLDGWIANAHTYNDPIMAQQQAQQTEAETEQANADALARRQQVNALYAELLSGGAVPEAARQQMLANGYTEAEIAEAVQLYTGTNAAQQIAALNIEGLSMADIPTIQDINNRVIAGQLSEEQGKEIKALAQKKRVELLENDYKDLAKLDEKTASARAAEWKATIDSLSSEDLPDVERGRLYGMMVDGFLSSAVETKMPMSNLLQEISAQNKEAIGDAAYNGMIDAATDAITIDYLSESTQAGQFSIRINTGINEKGKNTGQYVQPTLKSVHKKSELSNSLGTAEGTTIKKYNGKLYINSRTGVWYEITGILPGSVSYSKENANVMYDILLNYYS